MYLVDSFEDDDSSDNSENLKIDENVKIALQDSPHEDHARAVDEDARQSGLSTERTPPKKHHPFVILSAYDMIFVSDVVVVILFLQIYHKNATTATA